MPKLTHTSFSLSWMDFVDSAFDRLLKVVINNAKTNLNILVIGCIRLFDGKNEDM